MKKTKTYNVQIWCGLRKGYTDDCFTLDDVYRIVDGYIEMKEGDCVTVTPTEYRYLHGNEPGFVVGWINYPRFPRESKEIDDRAFLLAQGLMMGLEQNRVRS